ncbi:hypothetical protein PAPHI01_2142 [Pancytospora philotis]|nr:hypothetical protein PAPHI01_2142 [Pancytospora philotis]
MANAHTALYLMVTLMLRMCSGAPVNKCGKCTVVQQDCSSDSDLYEEKVCSTGCCSRDKKVKVVRSNRAFIRAESDCSGLLKIIKGALQRLDKALCRLTTEEISCFGNDLSKTLGAQDDRLVGDIQNEVVKAVLSIEGKVGDIASTLAGHLATTGTQLTESLKKALGLATKAAQNDLFARINAVSLLPDADIVTYVTSATGLKADITAATDKINVETDAATGRIVKEYIEYLAKEVSAEMRTLRKVIKKTIYKLEGAIKGIAQMTKGQTCKFLTAALAKTSDALINRFEAAIQQTMLMIAIYLNQAAGCGSKGADAGQFASVLLLNSDAHGVLGM